MYEGGVNPNNTLTFDAFNGSSGTPGNNMNTIYTGSTAIMGTDLSDDHPVGVDITKDPDGIYDEPTITSAGLLLYDNKVECASCHDAHGVTGYDSFLRIENANSAMCTACHKK